MAQEDPPWLLQCEQNVKILGGRLCSPQLCEDWADSIAAVCSCKPPYTNGCISGPAPGCCAYTASSPMYVYGGRCYCCCGVAGWVTECTAAIAELGGPACSPSVTSSGSTQAFLRAYCTCTPPYQDACHSAPGACTCTGGSPVFVNGSNCYACCGAALAATFTAVDGVHGRSAEEFAEGDLVFVAEDASLGRWTQREVRFSAGVAATGLEVPALRIRFRTDEETSDWVVADRNRPFLLAERTLRRAGELKTGDVLVGEHGAPAPVLEVAEVAPRIVHQLATSREPATGVDGHLLLVHGVVAGDYALQLADLEAINRSLSDA